MPGVLPSPTDCCTPCSDSICVPTPLETIITEVVQDILASIAFGYVNVKNAPYNATGNGTTDDTLAIQTAMAAVGRGLVFFPPGVYKTSASLVPARGQTLLGCGYTADPTASQRAATCILKSGNYDGITINLPEVQIRNLQVDGNGNGGDGIYCAGPQAVLDCVSSTGNLGAGFRFGSKTASTNTNLGRFTRLQALGNASHGVYVHDTTPAPNVNACRWDLLDLRSNGGDGIRVENALANYFTGVLTESNSGCGVRFMAAARGQVFDWTYMEADTLGTAIFELGSSQCEINGTRPDSPDLIVDNNGANSENRILGRDYSKHAFPSWRQAMARIWRVSDPAYTGDLFIQQSGNDEYELRNKGNTAGTVKIRCDGAPGVGILDADRLIVGVTGLTVDGSANVGIGTASQTTDLEIVPRGTGTSSVIINGTAANVSGSILWQKGANQYRAHIVPYDTNNVAFAFDCAFVGGNWVSGNVAANYRIYKNSGNLVFDAATGVAAGGNIPSFTEACHLTGAGWLALNKPAAVESGGNAVMGQANLVAGTVTVPNTRITATSRIFLTIQTPGGSPGAVYISARSAGVSFDITSTDAGDTSVVGWLIVEGLP